MKNYPQGTFLLIFTQLWESFSFFGMRTLLVLFMIQKLGYHDANAIGTFALYATLVNLGGVIGGYCGDRYLGLKAAVLIGGSFITMGHILLTVEEVDLLFSLGLSFIIVGSALFSPNLKGLFGQLFAKSEESQESGFTLYYMGINLGGFAAAVLCGYAAQIYGWHIGFGLAALSMLSGLIIFLLSQSILGDLGKAPSGSTTFNKALVAFTACLLVVLCVVVLQAQALVTPYISCIGILLVGGMIFRIRADEAFQKVLTACGFVLPYMLFFTIEDLMSTLLIIFCEGNVDRVIGGFEIPSTALVAVNPLVIVGCGGIFAYWSHKRNNNPPSSTMLKMYSLGFLTLGTAFAILTLGVYQTTAPSLVPLYYVIVSFSCIALGELFVAPPLFAFCAKTIPDSLTGQMMGLLTMGRSYASLFSGMLGKFVVTSPQISHSHFFLITALTCIIVAVGLKAFSNHYIKVKTGRQKIYLNQ